MLYTETVEAGTLDLIKQLMQDKELSAFNLVGGTALSLQLGHRKSIDIDLFTDKDFDAIRMSRHLSKTYNAEISGMLTNGVFCYINNVKSDFIAHQYPIKKIETIDGIRMLSLEDIGAMKLNVILYNGTRLKDFVDMHSLLECVPLNNITATFEKKYPDVNKQMAHTALLYHNDVNLKDKIDFTSRKISWKEIADRLREAVLNDHKILKSRHLKEEQQKEINESLKQNPKKRQGKRPEL